MAWQPLLNCQSLKPMMQINHQDKYTYCYEHVMESNHVCRVVLTSSRQVFEIVRFGKHLCTHKQASEQMGLSKHRQTDRQTDRQTYQHSYKQLSDRNCA